MNYQTMSLADLKKVAKTHTPKIKYYYIKSRKELIDILTQPDVPHTMVIEKMRVQELRAEAKKRGFGNIWKLRRHELVELLYPSPQENN
jgi:hypothetical protein